MKLTNEEIARVFAMYWGNVSFRNGIGGRCILSLMDCNDIGLGRIAGKLLLTPLDKISDEHAIEVSELMEVSKVSTNRFPIADGKILIDRLYTNVILCNGWMLHDYLKINGYAVPLFFGLNHWANGKTAIELKIAKDKTIQLTN